MLCLLPAAKLTYAQQTGEGSAPADGTASGELVPALAQTSGLVVRGEEKKFYHADDALFKTGKELMRQDFSEVEFGNIPSGWTDLLYRRPSRNWIVDEFGFLRHVLKNRNNRLTYDPFSDSFLESPTPETRPGLIAWGATSENTAADQAAADQAAAIQVRAAFKKTEDTGVFFGIAGRIQDKHNFYAVLVRESNKLTIVKVESDSLIVLTEIVSLRRYRYPELWTLTVSFKDDLITGILHDEKGNPVARVDARDAEFRSSYLFGLYCTDYAAARSVSARAPEGSFSANPPAGAGIPPVTPVLSPLAQKDRAPVYDSYKLIKPADKVDLLNTSFDAVDDQYDIVIAGAGSSGWAAAVQAARMGRRVLLLEETDWIGGQMAAAAVTSMDESGPLIRERGIYRQFHESMVAYYYGRDKCPFVAYFWGRQTQNQQEGGYEPAVVRRMLYGFIQDAREKAASFKPGGRLDLLLRTRVTEVKKNGNKVTGVTITQWNEGGREQEKHVNCGVLVDATEYGDVIPLTGAPYRVGNTKSQDRNYQGVVQDHTYTAVIREYPGGVPEDLKIKVPPPGYEKYGKKYRSRVLYGDWGLHRGARMFRAELAWRGMADTRSPLTGKASQLRHTLTGLNGGNDYPTTVGTLELTSQRMKDELEGIYRTLSKIYYLQHELGVPWSVAEDQGFNTAYNREMMRRRGVPESLLHIAIHMPQMPYVRESRRIEGIEILVADDLKRWENAVHQPTSVAVGDYFMDLHGTYDAFEKDLDDENYARNGGPFQVPFEVFIPLKLDGFLPAEKNFSQSRLVSGATRLQPITMLTGQAVGVMAALATEKGVQPRKLNPLAVQLKLLDEGATLIPRWNLDVVWNTELWKATQLLSLYKILDPEGGLEYWDGMEFAADTSWGVGQSLTAGKLDAALKKLSELLNTTPGKLRSSASDLFNNGGAINKGEFALFCLAAIRKHIQEK